MSYGPPPDHGPPPGWGPPPGPPPRPSSSSHGWVLAAVAGLAVVVLGLAGIVTFSIMDSSSGKHDDYVDALAALARGSATAKTDAEANCLAEGQVDALGTDTLEKVGTPEELQADPETRLTDRGLRATPAQAEDLYAVTEDCVGVREAFRRRGIDQGQTEDAVSCVSDAIDDDLMKRLTIASYVDGPEYLEKNPELGDALNQAVSGCDVA